MRRVTNVATPVAHLVGPGKLKVVNGKLAYSTEGDPPLRLDPEALTTVLCYGPVGVTDEAMQMLFRHGVEVAFLTAGGTICRGRLVRSDPSTTALRMVQHQVLSREECQRELARWIVANKIESQVHAARHYQRQGSTAARPVLHQLQEATEACRNATTVEQLRGVEGSSSAAWFGLLGQLLNPPWVFNQRTRRPPTDPVNALLSLGYTWLLTRTVARCEATGLEVNLGALHEFRPGRPSLACDLIEPLRVPAVDRWVVAQLNQGLVTPDDFRSENGGIYLQPASFARMLHRWETHWLTEHQEQSLEAMLACVVQQLRQWGPSDSAGSAQPDL